MAEVDIRWRPSGGRGEYEHVPSEVLMDRRIVISAVSVDGGLIATDVWGRQRDGKPRLRREDPNDRVMLNVPPLIAALALFPDPMREDKGSVVLPLRDKGYVVSSVTCHVEYAGNGDAICTPLRMQILHDTSTIDLFSRLRGVGSLLGRPDLPKAAQAAAANYRSIVEAGLPLSELRAVADELRVWLDHAPAAFEELEAPSSEVDTGLSHDQSSIEYSEISVDETKRRLVSHYKIDRDRGIRSEKIKDFLSVHGRLFCEACSFSFPDRYGPYAENVIDVHHIRPLASLLPNTMTKLSDLMLLCPNCHRVIHRKRAPLSPDELRALLREYAGLEA